jgi:predicted Zn-dependent peptidase
MRRYFGSWSKADRKVPSTFTQPEPPPAALLTVASPQTGTAELRYALRGVSRSDKDLGASLVFTKVLEGRLRSSVGTAHHGDVFVRNEPHFLPGMIVIGMSSAGRSDEKVEANDLVAKALAGAVTEAEFQAAKAAVRIAWALRSNSDLWLDADTFQIPNREADAAVPDAVTLAAVNAYAAKLRQAPVAAVLVNTPAKE